MQQLPGIAQGTLTIYRIYDIGYEIDLPLAQTRLADGVIRRAGQELARQASSIRIAQPPLAIELERLPATLAGRELIGSLRADIYDLGAVALALQVPLPLPTDWPLVANLEVAAQELPDNLRLRFEAGLAEVERLLGPAIIRPQRKPIVEDYSILLIQRFDGPVEVATLANNSQVRSALLGEQRPLSDDARALVSSTSYYRDDLALLSWNGALLIEPDPLAAATAADLLEFANVELLLLRSYDADLDAELPQMYRRVSASLGHFAIPLVRRHRRLLHDIQVLVAEVRELTERVDNALKVTDDVYWNRLYGAVINALQVDVWRRGVEHKLVLLRETYAQLHDAAESERSTVLEWIVIVLIAVEIIMAFV